MRTTEHCLGAREQRLFDAWLAGSWRYVRDEESDGYVWHRFEQCEAPRAPLAPREEEVVRGLVAGTSGKTLALELGVSASSIVAATRSALDKLGLRSRFDLIAVALLAEGVGAPQ